MAEIVGVVASAFTLLELTAKTLGACQKLINTSRDASTDLRFILTEVTSLKSTLERLVSTPGSTNESSDVLQEIGVSGGAIQDCGDIMDELGSQLKDLEISNPGKRQKLKQSLGYCLKEGKARKLLGQAIQHKTTISLALLSEIAPNVKEATAGIWSLQGSHHDDYRMKVCQWLECHNPSDDHNNAKRLHEAKTTAWINKHEIFSKWFEGSHKFVWINGIPGAGKTVLLSSIVELTTGHVIARNQSVENNDRMRRIDVCIYYYFSYRHTGDDVGAFLQWIVSQLCRRIKKIPNRMSELYEASSKPSHGQLMNALSILLNDVHQLYLVIDAIDECRHRGLILRILNTFHDGKNFEKVRVIATSRLYSDIEYALNPICEAISMSNEYVDADIKQYVDSELEKSMFERWPKELKQRSSEALTKGARGMFRWATCQLFVLRRKKSEKEIIKALTELPKTLDEMYERILTDVLEDQEHVRKALLWICAHEMLPFKHAISANALTSVIYPEGVITPADGESNVIQELCGCLVRTTKVQHLKQTNNSRLMINHSYTISLAHYTVKEFLFSNRLSENSNRRLASFHMSDEEMASEYLNTVMSKCLKLVLIHPPGDEIMDNFNEYCRAATYLAQFGKIPGSDRHVEDVILNHDDLLHIREMILKKSKSDYKKYRNFVSSDKGVENDAQRTSKPTQPSGTGLQFACPFYKRSPFMATESCGGPDGGFVNPTRLKDHLRSRHWLHQCGRCSKVLATEVALQRHVRGPRCNVGPEKVAYGMTRKKNDAFRDQWGPHSVSPKARWKHIFLVLFSGVRDEDVPSPWTRDI